MGNLPRRVQATLSTLDTIKGSAVLLSIRRRARLMQVMSC